MLFRSPNFTTPGEPGTKWREVEINCGRLDFELWAWHDCRLHLLPEMKMEGQDSVYILIGGWDANGNNSRRSKWIIGGAEHGVARNVQTLLTALPFQGDFRKFWIKWDATNLYFGPGESTVPIAAVLNHGDGFKCFKYFGLQSVDGAHADWRILNPAEPHGNENI